MKNLIQWLAMCILTMILLLGITYVNKHYFNLGFYIFCFILGWNTPKFKEYLFKS